MRVVNGNTFILDNVEVMYASVHTPNKIQQPDGSTKEVYELKAIKLTKEQTDWVNSLKGPNGAWTMPRTSPNQPEWGTYLKLKSNFKPNSIVDAKGETIPPTTLIGNGSKCNVAFTRKEVRSNTVGQTKTSFFLDSLQVVDLVPYEKKEAQPTFGPATPTLKEVE